MGAPHSICLVCWLIFDFLPRCVRCCADLRDQTQQGGVYNFAPFACQLVQSTYSHMDLCGRIPHDAVVVPPNVSIVPGSSVVITGSQLDTHQAIIFLEEVPAHVDVSGNELRDGAAPGILVLNVTKSLNLSGIVIPRNVALLPPEWSRGDLWDGLRPHIRHQSPYACEQRQRVPSLLTLRKFVFPSVSTKGPSIRVCWSALNRSVGGFRTALDRPIGTVPR